VLKLTASNLSHHCAHTRPPYVLNSPAGSVMVQHSLVYCNWTWKLVREAIGPEKSFCSSLKINLFLAPYYF
jgi:hypothetical protein